MPKKFVYEIDNLMPPFKSDGQFLMGRYGFNIYLDADFAKKAMNTSFKEQKLSLEKMQGVGKEIIIGYKLEERKNLSLLKPAYQFYRNNSGDETLLVQFMNVPGNACDIGADYNEINNLKEDLEGYKKQVEYRPHNVDSPLQSLCLVSLFTYWANKVSLFLRE